MGTKSKGNQMRRIPNKRDYICQGSRPMRATGSQKVKIRQRRGFLGVSVPASQDYIGDMRHRAGEFARAQSFPKDDVDAVTLAVGEAVDNAVKYGSRAKADPSVEMLCRAVSSDEIEIDVTNAGNRFHPNLAEMTCLPSPESYCTHGRGFGLMTALMDEVSVHTNGDSTTVHLVKRKSN